MRPQFLNSEIRDLYSQGKLSQAVSRCQDLLGELRAKYGETHPSVASAQDQLAQLYFDCGSDREAVDATLRVLEIDKSLFGEVNADYVRNLSNLGLLYRRVGRLGDAQVALDHALGLFRQLPRDEQWDGPPILMNLARVYADNEDYASAQRLLIEAVRQSSHDCNPCHPRVGDVLMQLSSLYWKMKRYVAAERTIHKAMRIYRNAAATEDPNYAMMATFLGHLLANKGEVSAARESYQIAIEILRRVRPEASAKISSIERELAKLNEPKCDGV